MKNKKKIIDKYTQPIYVPNTLYVCRHCTKEDLDKMFNYTDAEESSIYEDTDSYSGLTCYGVKDKTTGNLCIVILLADELDENDMKDNINIIAHESFHAAHRILQYCSINLSDETAECFAFMVGWCAECVFKTMSK